MEAVQYGVTAPGNMFERERDPLGAQPREPSHLGRKTRARVREDIACINGRIMVAIQSSFIRQLLQSDFSVPRRRFQAGERVIAGIPQMTPILRGLASVGTREGEASSAVLIWIAPTLLEPDFAANRQDPRTMQPTSDKVRPTKTRT